MIIISICAKFFVIINTPFNADSWQKTAFSRTLYPFNNTINRMLGKRIPAIFIKPVMVKINKLMYRSII